MLKIEKCVFVAFLVMKFLVLEASVTKHKFLACW